MDCDRLWLNAQLATMAVPGSEAKAIAGGVVACRDGRILFAGPADEAPAFQPASVTDCRGRLVTPGLIDCHTHLVYAGNRAGEFERRLAGESYEAIAREGGGILSTVRATRAASAEELAAESAPRLNAIASAGVTTVEIKSGYGLTLEGECKQLRVARDMAGTSNVRVRTTFLGAHALPPEFAGKPDDYVTLICDVMLPEIAEQGLADAVDAYCETIGFNAAQVGRVFEAAAKLGLPVKLHAEQLSDFGGAEMAASYGALSADHLEYAGEDAVTAMAQSSTVAVLLPGAFYFTRESKVPPVELLRRHGVPMAVATDCNPGTSPLTSPLLAMNMAATLFRLTVAECLAGMTREAARALGLAGEIGTLEAGKACDLAIWDAAQPADLVYPIGFNPLHQRVLGGKDVR